MALIYISRDQQHYIEFRNSELAMNAGGVEISNKISALGRDLNPIPPLVDSPEP